MKKAREVQPPWWATTSGGTPAVRSLLAPPIRKLWLLTAGRPAVFQIEEQKARKKDFIGIELPEGEAKEKRGVEPGMSGFMEK
jgi:hypothetical protein